MAQPLSPVVQEPRPIADATAQTDRDASQTVPLAKIASVIRSKLAGPFRVTFDVIFPDHETYHWVRTAQVLTKERIAALYGVPLSRISSVFEVPEVNAIKFTMTRTLDPIFATSDSHGAQQHVPLLGVAVPVRADACERWT